MIFYHTMNTGRF